VKDADFTQYQFSSVQFTLKQMFPEVVRVGFLQEMTLKPG